MSKVKPEDSTITSNSSNEPLAPSASPAPVPHQANYQHPNQPGTTVITLEPVKGMGNVAYVQMDVPQSDKTVYKEKSIQVVCFACQSQVWTTTSAKLGIAVWGSVLLAIIMGCVYGCCLLPLCVRQLKDTIHTCPNCKVQVGRHEVVKF